MSTLARLPPFLLPLRPLPPRRTLITSLWVEIVSPENKVANFQIEDQKLDMWCWVAVSLGVVRLFETASTLTQCALASRFALGDPPTRRDCCGSNASLCNQPNSLTTVLSDLSHLADSNVTGTVPFDRIRQEIDAQRPVCARILDDSADNVGHFVAITGYKAVGDRQYLQVHDPADNGPASNVRSDMPIEEFTHAYWGMPSKWTHSYRTE